ncbi:RimK family alpha-L-glutamate ligase [Thermodesulfobacteriota bacterium]
MRKTNSLYIAIGSRLKGVPEVMTIGLRPNFSDYLPREKEYLLNAGTILYPTLNYAQFFSTMGKKIFPSLESYLYADEKIKQTTLFNMLGLQHPRTRFYYPLHHGDILKDFRFPFIAKIPRASAQGRGVFKIHNQEELESYLRLTKVAYIQDYLPHNRDLRIILINYQSVLAYWRESRQGNFRTNLFQGGAINFNDVPPEPLRLAQEYAKKCKFNDVGLDFIFHGGKWYMIEANMKYGRKGIIKAGLNLKEILRGKLLSGELIG